MSHSVERKKASKQSKRSKCLQCNKMFDVCRPWQKFCGRVCRYKNWDISNPRVKKGGENGDI